MQACSPQADHDDSVSISPDTLSWVKRSNTTSSSVSISSDARFQNSARGQNSRSVQGQRLPVSFMRAPSMPLQTISKHMACDSPRGREQGTVRETKMGSVTISSADLEKEESMVSAFTRTGRLSIHPIYIRGSRELYHHAQNGPSHGQQADSQVYGHVTQLPSGCPQSAGPSSSIRSLKSTAQAWQWLGCHGHGL